MILDSSRASRPAIFDISLDMISWLMILWSLRYFAVRQVVWIRFTKNSESRSRSMIIEVYDLDKMNIFDESMDRLWTRP